MYPLISQIRLKAICLETGVSCSFFALFTPYGRVKQPQMLLEIRDNDSRDRLPPSSGRRTLGYKIVAIVIGAGLQAPNAVFSKCLLRSGLIPLQSPYLELGLLRCS